MLIYSYILSLSLSLWSSLSQSLLLARLSLSWGWIAGTTLLRGKRCLFERDPKRDPNETLWEPFWRINKQLAQKHPKARTCKGAFIDVFKVCIDYFNVFLNMFSISQCFHCFFQCISSCVPSLCLLDVRDSFFSLSPSLYVYVYIYTYCTHTHILTYKHTYIHYITLHYITLHYITYLHTYIHTYITYIHTYITYIH